MRMCLQKLKRFFLAVILFSISSIAQEQNVPSSDFNLTTAAVLGIMVLIVLILTILVSFSLKQDTVELYMLTTERKNIEENGKDSNDTFRLNNYQIAKVLLTHHNSGFKI